MALDDDWLSLPIEDRVRLLQGDFGSRPIPYVKPKPAPEQLPRSMQQPIPPGLMTYLPSLQPYFRSHPLPMEFRDRWRIEREEEQSYYDRLEEICRYNDQRRFDTDESWRVENHKVYYNESM